jgi:Fe2+ transport system protein FeoA
MTVYSRLVRLKTDPKYQKKFKSKTGKVDVIWYERNKYQGEQYAQLVTSNQHPVIGRAGTMRHIDQELSYMPVVQDAVKRRKNTPTGPLHPVTTIVGHPGLQGDRDFLKKRMTNVKDKWVDKERLIAINKRLKQLGFNKGVDVEEIRQHPTKPITFYRIRIGDFDNE